MTEGTYPFAWGGVSTWGHALVHGLDQVRFTILAIIGDPNRRRVFDVPEHVPVLAVPLWGTRRALEVGLPGPSRVPRAGPREPAAPAFLEALRFLLEAFWSVETDLDELGRAVASIHRHVVGTDFGSVMGSQATWELFCRAATQSFSQAAAAAGYPHAPLAMSDLIRGFELVTRWLQPLAVELPECDVVHAAMAGMCTLVAAAAKLEHGAAFLLSEHGIYLREAFLSESRSDGSLFVKLLSLGFARRATELGYHLADCIAPCCDDHKRWELRLGADPSRLRTLYYGVDADAFRPVARPPDRPPTVVWVGRIDPLKDVETLLRAAAIVRSSRPDVRFRLFGSAPAGNEDYHDRCLALYEQLDLGDAVTFEGYTSSPAAAFNQGDLAVLTSISEGFPYSTLEAMLCGCPVVATAVGGVPEQVGDCGIVVEPCNPVAVARAIVDLMSDAPRLLELGVSARRRSADLFSLQRFLADHHDVYRRVSGARSENPPPVAAADPAPRAQGAGRLPARRRTPASLVRLTAAVVRSIPVPTEPLEVAAVIESHGVTPAVSARLCSSDTFQLAELIIARVRRRSRRVGLRPFDPTADTRLPAQQRSRSGFMVALAPALAVMVVLGALSEIRAETGAAILGTGLALVVSNGLLQGLAPRASLYAGCENWSGLRRTVVSFGVGAGGLTILIGALAMAVAGWAGVGTMRERLVFVASYWAMSVFWTSGAGLFALRVEHSIAGSVVVGVAAGLVVMEVDRRPGALLPVGLGYALTLLALVADTVRRFRRLDAGRQPLLAIPRTGVLVREAAPYVAFGALVMALLLSPHWLAMAASGGRVASASFLQYEVAVNLALPVLLLAMVFAERSMDRFWVKAIECEVATPGGDPDTLTARLCGLAEAAGRAQAWVLAAGSVAVMGATDLALRLAPGVASRVGIVEPGAFEVTLISSVAASAVIGWAYLNCSFASGLGSPGGAVAAVAVGVAVSVVSGAVALTFLPLELLPIATVLGSGTFASLARRSRRQLMLEAAYRYAVRS